MKRPMPDPDLTPPSPYDRDPASDSDLWFLPEDDGEVAAPPLPRADRRALLQPADWRAAEAALAPDLARAAQRFGALDERLRRATEGVRSRLALVESAEFSWWSGDRVTPDRLALWLALRLDGVQDDSLALARAGWAVRRLTSGPGPDARLAEFLGRPDVGQDWLTDWQEIEHATLGMHPITRAALGFHAWGLLSSPGASARMEAAVVAARIGAAEGRGATFLPLATGGSTALRPGGSPGERLARWYAGAEQATRAALRLLDRLDDWQEKAAAATSSLSGRTPPLLIAALVHWPLLSAPVAEVETRASRAAVQRNIDRFARLGLIREVTGQGRFRLWSAAI